MSPAGATRRTTAACSPSRSQRQRRDLDGAPASARRARARRAARCAAPDGSALSRLRRRLAAGELQEAAGVLRQVHDVVLVGDQHRRRRDPLDQLEVQLAPRHRRPHRPCTGPAASRRWRTGAAGPGPAAPGCRAATSLLQLEGAGERALPRRRRQPLPRDLARCVKAMLLVDRVNSGARCRRSVSDAPRNSRPLPLSAKWAISRRAPLRLGVEVDEQVAAAEEIDARERRVLQQVVHGEQHGLAQISRAPGSRDAPW